MLSATTMTWIDGVSALNEFHAYVAAILAFIFFAWFGAHQQDKFYRIWKGWHIAPAYVIGFFALYLIMGWEPADNKEHKIINCPVPGCPMAGQEEPGERNVSYPELVK